jgi:hypothetical protein
MFIDEKLHLPLLLWASCEIDDVAIGDYFENYGCNHLDELVFNGYLDHKIVESNDPEWKQKDNPLWHPSGYKQLRYTITLKGMWRLHCGLEKMNT